MPKITIKLANNDVLTLHPGISDGHGEFTKFPHNITVIVKKKFCTIFVVKLPERDISFVHLSDR